MIRGLLNAFVANELDEEYAVTIGLPSRSVKEMASSPSTESTRD